ncbi:MAG: hypothetical protein ACK5YW_11665 [Betaproteobacteria bacterium]|jgi:hypothetical protein|nr:hypothetical protein [Rhodocyclaceae bacterium]MCA3133614.1 hypothetical protein [Rhodocyclaceae bacterium]MCA3142935.1 hypothetical protein [Rhodocyclaceae bacterium]MCA3144042.1 hypothetical protein [Rhodocyclaceae bacterium]MCE2897594.1 hypothetical protein [Betaproteobacteria bacterium]
MALVVPIPAGKARYTRMSDKGVAVGTDFLREPFMKRSYGAVAACFLVVSAGDVRADRVSEMSRADRCAYSARMQVLAAHYSSKGTPRAQVKIHWHGDESANEVAFVNRLLDEGYAAWAEARARHGEAFPLELFGDAVFERCMREAES